MVKNGKLLRAKLAHIFKIKKLHEHVTSSNIQDIRILSKMLNLVKQHQGNMDRKCFLQLTSCLITKRFDTYLDEKRNIVKQGEYVNEKIRALNQFVLDAKMFNLPNVNVNANDDNDVDPENRECYRLLAQHPSTKYNLTTDPLIWINHQDTLTPRAQQQQPPSTIFCERRNVQQGYNSESWRIHQEVNNEDRGIHYNVRRNDRAHASYATGNHQNNN